ncbi:hypothetical protein PHLGIDRAFT_32893 [Phlebiopsis gigantea 11061_1 CR5-6]|uniref:Uncharacterized protein n=1 Tax=Phlebiopsis gigantea (strain 11061_1 CR5-6) TaxID=745531 RepID=A0A0C3SFK7_PHLG1|nr:hypothetical protein PHLGIDRAFT_32893 [Phlebiopsis gigantea 11061_1 CR5-6]
MSEPAYASLLFTSNCTFCGKAGIQTIEWLILARCCKTCRHNTDLFVNLNSEAAQELGVQPWHNPYLLSITHNNASYARRPDVLRFVTDIAKCEGRVENLADVLATQLRGFKEFIEQVSPRKQWHVARLQDRQRELADIREQRRNAVWAKLAELGLGEERTLMNDWRMERLEAKEGMKETTLLTDRGWEKIKDSLILYVQNARKERIREERYTPYYAVIYAFKPHLDEYARAQPLTEVFPSILEFCMTPQIRPIVEELVQVGADGLNVGRLKELIPPICEGFKDDISSRVLKLLPPWLLRGDMEEGSPLDSALVWFHCARTDNIETCHTTTIAYPRIIQHRHVYFSPHWSSEEPQTADDDLMNAVHESWGLRKTKFSPALLEEHITFDLHASFVAAELVSLCGLDPAIASSADMDALDCRVACIPCGRVMTWRKAVSHIFKPCHKGAREWVLLDGADARELKGQEARSKPKAAAGSYSCMQCRQFDGQDFGTWQHKSTKELKAHIATRHGVQITRAKEGRDFYHRMEGEPTSDRERPYAVQRKNLQFEVSTPALRANGW